MRKFCLVYAFAVCCFCSSLLYAQGAGSSNAFMVHWNQTNLNLINLENDINLVDPLGSARSVDLTIDGLGHTLTLNNNTLVYLPDWNNGLSATIQNVTINGATNGAVEFNGDGQNDHVYTVTNSTFTGNSSSANGGAIYSHAQAQVAGSSRSYTFSGNVFSNNSAQNGGALFNASNNSQLPVEFTITGGAFNSNSTMNGNGGAIYNYSNYGSGADLNNSFTIGAAGAPVTFANNSAINGSGGAVYNFSNNPTSNGLSVFDMNGIFSGNLSANGGAVTNQVEGGNGITEFYAVGSFDSNKATQNGGAVANYIGASGNAPYGGNITIDLSSVTAFTNNVAVAGSGGAIYNYVNSGGSTGYEVAGGTFTNNSAGLFGGAIYNYATAYSPVIALNIMDGSYFSNNKAQRGFAIYNDNLGVINLNSDAIGITFTKNLSASAMSNGAVNDIYQASSNGIINIYTSDAGEVFMDGGIAGLGTVNRYSSVAASTTTPPAAGGASPGSLWFDIPSNSSGFTGTFNHYYGETDMFGAMFGGINNIYNAPNAQNGDMTAGAFGGSVLNVFSSAQSLNFNANMFSNALLNYTVETSLITSINGTSALTPGYSGQGLSFQGSGATVNFYNSSRGVTANIHLQNDISDGQSNTINFNNALVAFTNDASSSPVTNFTNGTTYGFINSIMDLARSDTPLVTAATAAASNIHQYTFDSLYLDNAQLYIKVAGAGSNFIADSLSATLAAGSGNTIDLSKLYIYDTPGDPLNGSAQVLFPQIGSADLTLTLDNSDTYIVTSNGVYNVGLTPDLHGITFNEVSPPSPTPLDLNDVNACTPNAENYGISSATARGWQLDAGTYYFNPSSDVNVSSGLQSMAAGELTVYGSVPDDVTSVLSGDFSGTDPALANPQDKRSMFNIVSGQTVIFNLDDLSVRDAAISTTTLGAASSVTDANGAVLRMNDAASTASFRYVNILNNSAQNNGGAIDLINGTVNLNLTNFTGNSAGGNGGAINVDGGTLNYNSSNPSDLDVSFNHADGSGGIVNQNAGSVTIQDIVIAEGNTANANGGAISHFGGDMTISASVGGSLFFVNASGGNGGVIYNAADNLTITGNMEFVSNNANSGLGGAIYNASGVSMNLNSTNGAITFVNNTDSTGANDIYNDGTINIDGGSSIMITGGVSGGGTINKTGTGGLYLFGSNSNGNFDGTYNQNEGTLYVSAEMFGGTNTISGGNLFWVNSAAKQASSSLVVQNASLIVAQNSTLNMNNDSDLIDKSDIITIDPTSQIIVSAPGASLHLDAKDTWQGKVSMSAGNITMDAITNLYNSDYVQSGGTLNLIDGSVLTMGGKSVITGGDIYMDNSVINTNGYGIYVASGTSGTGSLSMNNNSLLNGMNGVLLRDTFAGNLTVNNSTANFAVDLDPKNKVSDAFVFGGTIDPGVINISDFDLLSTPTEKEIPFQIFVASSITNITFATAKTEIKTAIGTYGFAPIAGQPGWYLLSLMSLDPDTGRGQGSILALISGQMQTNSTLFDHVFFDSNQLSVDDTKCYYRYMPSQFLQDNREKKWWVKTYYENESQTILDDMQMKSDLYGGTLGLDFAASDIGENSYFMPTVYVGYNGASETFGQATMNQNALQAGGMLSAMINNVWTISALAYVGAYQNNMDVAGFEDSPNNWFAGAAIKNGYNMYLDNFILQPNVLVSYTHYGKQQWDSSYGDITMTTNGTNAFDAAPGISLIYALESWNFMLNGDYTFNLGDPISGKAGDIDLPDINLQSGYFEYGGGVSKIFSKNLNVWVKALFKTNRDQDIGVSAGAGWRF